MMMRLYRSFWESKKFAWILLAISLLLASSSLLQGRYMDDHVQYAKFTGMLKANASWYSPVMSMFDFVNPSNGEYKRLKETGLLPWWSAPSLRLSFFRPVSAMTHFIDYRLWPESPWVMHFHSLLWFAGVLLLLLTLYRQLFSTHWVANLAAFCFATFSGFAIPVFWIANRNALIAVFFGLLVMLLHWRWRKDAWMWGSVLAPLVFVIALLSAEAAIATTAYLFAYACFLDPEKSFLKRLLTLIPYAVIVVIWRITYVFLGYKTYGSGLYVDPGQEPWVFLLSTFERLPMLFMSLFVGMSPSINVFLSSCGQLFFWFWSVLIILLCVIAFWHLRNSPKARFSFVGMMLSFLPVCATFADDRSLWFAAIGGMGLLALFFHSCWEEGFKTVAFPRFNRFFLYGMIAIHLVLSPLLFPVRGWSMWYVDSLANQSAKSVVVTKKTQNDLHILLHSGMLFLDMSMPLRKAVTQQLPMKFLTVLAPGDKPIKVKRIDAKTFRMTPQEGFLRSFDLLLRNPRIPFEVGKSLKTPAFVATVRKLLKDGRPAVVDFRFFLNVDDKKLHFFYGGKKFLFRPFTPPKVGKSVVLPVMSPL